MNDNDEWILERERWESDVRIATPLRSGGES
jgi:hypothetical protein